MKVATVGLGLAVGVAALGGVLAATARAAAVTPKPVTEAVRVNVVNVEVFVTGRDGRPVYDLRPEEFELREDGAPAALTNFLAPTPPAASNAARTPPPRPTAAESAPLLREERQRTLVVFVDDLNLTPRTRKPVLDRLRSFLAERTAEGYRAVLLSFDRSLRQLTPLTSDPEVLAAALGTLAHAAFEGMLTRAERDDLLREMGRPIAQEGTQAGALDREMLTFQSNSFAQEQLVLNQALMNALVKVVDSLAGVPGGKDVLYVSDGVPLDPGADVLGETGALPGNGEAERDVTGMATLRSELREVVHRANASRITFYTINGGVSSGRDVSAEIAMTADTDVDSADFFSRDPSLTALAVGTGGLKLPNADALPAVAADLEASYSLGYSPSHYGDGRYHALSVRVKRIGVSVRCREGYLDKTPEKRQEDATSAALFAGGNSNPLEARVQLGSAQKQGRGKVLLPLTVLVPAGRIVLLENGGMCEGQVSVTIAAAKAGSRRSEVARKTFPIRVPSQHVDAFLKHDVTFDFSLIVDSGEVTVSVMARDDVSQVESVVVTDVGAEPAKS